MRRDTANRFRIRPGSGCGGYCAAHLHRALGPVTVDAIDEVAITTSRHTLLVDKIRLEHDAGITARCCFESSLL